MKRALVISSGVSVVFTTLAFAHIVFHNTVHMVTMDRAKPIFVAAHTTVAVVICALSLTGAYFLFTGGRGSGPQ
jgi:hypothetical protein